MSVHTVRMISVILFFLNLKFILIFTFHNLIYSSIILCCICTYRAVYILICYPYRYLIFFNIYVITACVYLEHESSSHRFRGQRVPTLVHCHRNTGLNVTPLSLKLEQDCGGSRRVV